MHNKKTWLKFMAAFAMAMLVAMSTFLVTISSAHAQPLDDGIGQAKYFEKDADAATRAASHSSSFVNTIPFWSSVFSYGGNVYPYQMVGTDPSQGSATTVVPTEIIPLKLTFSNGVTLDGSKKVDLTEDSPIFRKADFSSGHTQYGDAIQRAEFWRYVSTRSEHYQVLLGQPHIHHTVRLTVPAASGQVTVGKHSGVQIGLVDINWFDAQLQTIMAAEQISPKSLPIFLDYNTFLYDGGDPANCCILGYHSAVASVSASGQSVIQTYAFAAYSDPGIFSVPIEDVMALSHEISEWYNDPFTDNIVPNWASPLSPQYGCSNALETGDPLVGTVFTINNYHLQDEAFFSWFARQSPSLGIHGQYTYLGTFTTVPPVCTA